MSKQRTIALAKKLLNELASSDVEFYDSINSLLETLENKPEPSQSEIHLTTLLYQITEKLKLLEAHLREYSAEKNSMSNKLSSLYESIDGYGTSKLFKD